jgi:hypothetical protein
MHAMVLEAPRTPLVMRERGNPAPAPDEILVEIAACGVCRTDLHVVDGELPDPKLPIVPGHEIVGRVAAVGRAATGLAVGERIGVPWLEFTCGVGVPRLEFTCGVCPYCRAGRENLCDRPLFTGYTRDGGSRSGRDGLHENDQRSNLISVDDGYMPWRTGNETRKLIEVERVAFMFGSIVTPTTKPMRVAPLDGKIGSTFPIAGSGLDRGAAAVAHEGAAPTHPQGVGAVRSFRHFA